MSDSHLLSKTVIQNVSADLSNTNLDNLTSTGESHFQAPLVSGDNIKTINSNSLLGSGDLVITSVPVGTVLVFAGSTAPTGYLLCDGSAVSRTTYSALFSVIGTTYGVGDGSSTFNLPNFNYKSVWQDPNYFGISFAGSLPNITARAYTNNNQGAFLNSAFSGSFYGDTLGGTFNAGTTASGFAKGFNFDASRSSSVYQNGQTQVVPASVCIKFYIKY